MSEIVVAPPVAVMTPVSVKLPPAVILNVLPTLTVPNTNAPLLVMVTALLPLLLKDTAPPKLLLLPFVLKSMVAAPAVKLDVPVMFNVAV